MNDNDLDHLCKMLKQSHDTACKVSGFTDTMFLQALEAIVYLREQRDYAKSRLSQYALEHLQRLDDEIESRR